MYSEPITICSDVKRITLELNWTKWMPILSQCSYFKWKENNLEPNELVSSNQRQLNLNSSEAKETISGKSCQYCTIQNCINISGASHMIWAFKWIAHGLRNNPNAMGDNFKQCEIWVEQFQMKHASWANRNYFMPISEPIYFKWNVNNLEIN